jgi:hypothetical protein
MKRSGRCGILVAMVALALGGTGCMPGAAAAPGSASSAVASPAVKAPSSLGSNPLGVLPPPRPNPFVTGTTPIPYLNVMPNTFGGATPSFLGPASPNANLAGAATSPNYCGPQGETPPEFAALPRC